MINRKVTGIGCFAKPATLSRVFNNMVRNCTLGQFESTNPAIGQDMVGRVDDIGPLKALIAGKAAYFQAPDSDSGGVADKRKITGFFLSFRNRRLNLSIFAKGDRNYRQIYTTSLDGYTN